MMPRRAWPSRIDLERSVKPRQIGIKIFVLRKPCGTLVSGRPEANATAVEGENNAKILIADSDAIRREREAEAARKAIAAEKVQAAKALEEAYMAEKEAEIARAEREKATQAANIVVPAQIDKEKAIIDAEGRGGTFAPVGERRG